MNHADELPAFVDKSSEEINKAIAAIEACDLPAETRSFAISCIRLAVWLPRAFAEHKITLSNLRELIFGSGRKNKKSKRDGDKGSEAEGDTKIRGLTLSHRNEGVLQRLGRVARQ